MKELDKLAGYQGPTQERSKSFFRTAIEAARARFCPRHLELTPDIEKRLGVLASDLASSIQFKGFDRPFWVFGEEVQIEPQPQVFAQVLLTMAYLDGGEAKAAQVNQFVQERGLEVSFRGGLAAGSVDPKARPIKMAFTPIVIARTAEGCLSAQKTRQPPDRSKLTKVLDHLLSASPSTILHELHHLVQQPCETRFKRLISTLISVNLVGTCFYSRGFRYFDDDFQLVNFVSSLIIGVVGGVAIGQLLEPREFTTRLKTQIPGPWNLTAHPALSVLQRQLFLRQEAREEN